VASGIGEHLRRARSARGIDLEQVEERTKIRVRYLRAMEEERWEQLPGAAYARAFLRTYGGFLGLDPEALVDDYRRVHEPQQPEPDAEVRQIALPERRGIRLPGRMPEVPEARGRTIAAIGVAAVLAILLVLGLTQGSDDEGAPSGETDPAAGSPTDSGAPAEELEPSRVSLELRATGTVWVCVVDQRDRALVEGVTLAPGEEEGPLEARALKFTLGNGQVEMNANGDELPIPQAAEPLGYRVTAGGAFQELSATARPTCG
jgi:cytoskeleton protein RodZ